MTTTIYQVQGKEYASELEAIAMLVAVLGVPVEHVDWLDVTTIKDAANGIKRLIAGMVNHRIEPNGDSDLEEFLNQYRKPLAPLSEPILPASAPQPAQNPVQSADDCDS